MKVKILKIEDFGVDELCEHCSLTEFGEYTVNTSFHNLCYGEKCDEAYENYVDERKIELEPLMKSHPEEFI